MHIAGISTSHMVFDNIQSQHTDTNNLRSLSASCQLPEDVAQDEVITENEDVTNTTEASEVDEATKKAEDEAKAASKAMIMATMVAQYRVEAILGGEPDDESDPMYMSEW